MGIFFSLLLIALGVCAAQAFLAEKIPAARNGLEQYAKFQGFIGIAGIVFGVVWAFEWIATLRFLAYAPFHVLLALVGVLLTLALGLLFGLDFVRKNLRDPNLPFIVKLDGVRLKIMAHQRELGLVSIAVGIYYFFYYFFH